MKKILLLSVAFILALSFLSACSNPDETFGNESKPHEHSYGEWECDEFRHWREYTCGCDLEGEIGVHTNYDGDEFCDVCGYNVGFNRDDVLFCQYNYINEYGSSTHAQIALDYLNLDDLVSLSVLNLYTNGDLVSFETKIWYCIRHYDIEKKSFFITGDEQYLSLSGKFTSEYADVTYYIDYVNSQIIRKYTTINEEICEYAQLSLEQLNSVKEIFRVVADRLDYNG